MSHSIKLLALIAMASLAVSSAQAATVKEIFEKHDLIGVMAADCGKLRDPQTLYQIVRALDGGYVQLDQMVALTTRQFAAVIDQAAEATPNDIKLSYTVDNERHDGLIRAERGRMRTIELTSATGRFCCRSPLRAPATNDSVVVT
jgi:hypothetical protein